MDRKRMPFFGLSRSHWIWIGHENFVLDAYLYQVAKVGVWVSPVTKEKGRVRIFTFV